ncbi:MAG: pyruvate, phosphate dikinase [Candidatus Diapherotrites archaeon]
MKKYIYFFSEGNAGMKELLGGKGANLCEMTSLGLPVPQGFIVSTEACVEFFEKGGKMPEGLAEQIERALSQLEQKTKKSFGAKKNPLLVSVRSGARASMPGMMDTVLNLGLNSNTVKVLAMESGNEGFAFNCFRRLIQMFGDVGLGVKHEKFEEIIQETKKKSGKKIDSELNAEDWKAITKKFMELVKKEKRKQFPEDPKEQLMLAVKAVFNSWNTPRAIAYRKANNIPDNWGTAVSIQEMVFGNLGEESATGVAFTRNPITGEKELFGEYLTNAQGEDVVAGIRTPNPINELEKEFPVIFEQLKNYCGLLEKHFREMQDLEFTIEKGKLFMLQTRKGKRTANAAVRIAVEMVKEGLITEKEALLRIEPSSLNQLMHKTIDSKQGGDAIAQGIPASPGAASGKVVFTAGEAEEKSKKEKVILVRNETTPEDIHGMIAAQGILTTRGGNTAHAAIVARGMGKPCIVGCEEIKINLKEKSFSAKNYTVKDGDLISIDGTTGNVFLGQANLIEPKPSEFFQSILSWADKYRRLGLRANADTPKDALKAFELGAQGIGLCRTEHMFFAPERLPLVQEMIMSNSTEERKKFLAELEKMQKQDFIEIFKAMKGFPVTIRLIDPPLHEFLPQREQLIEEINAIKNEQNKNKEKELELHEKELLLKKVNELHEANPMLGLRGCRLGILYPEIIEMQVQAITEAAVQLKKEGLIVKPEIMIPLVGHANELKLCREITEKKINEVLERNKTGMEIPIGTMIELPRAALTADEIAEHAEFFSFGTNDLTQTTYGLSRDDAEGKFLFYYIDKKILPLSPFVSIDREGVGKLMRMGVELGRKKNPKLKIGICGEHGGDPNSIEFCHSIGLDYVSCSPFRVPIARLAAAQAALKNY